MRDQIVHYLTEREEAFVSTLTQLGMRPKTAVLLVFLAGRPEATSREIERGTDLRQPEVSLALKDLFDRGWVSHCDNLVEHQGRPQKVYALALPLPGILEAFQAEKQAEVRRKLALIAQIHDFL